MRSVGIVIGAWLLTAGLCLAAWAAQAPSPDNARFLAVLALDGSKSMQGFQTAGSLGRVVEAFQASAAAAGLRHDTLVFISANRAPAPPLWQPYRGQQGLDQLEGAYTHLPEAFDNTPRGPHFVFFLTDNLDNRGAAGGRLVERFRRDDVAAVLAVPMSLPFNGQVFENDLDGGCRAPDLERLFSLHQANGHPGRRSFAYWSPRGLIGYLVARNPHDPDQRRALVGPATDLLRELAQREVFCLRETGLFPMLPLKCFRDGLRGAAGELHPVRHDPVDLSRESVVVLEPLRLVLPALLPGVSVRADAPAGGPRQPVGLLQYPQLRPEEPGPDHAPWLLGRKQAVCEWLAPAAEDHLDTMRLQIKLGPFGREKVGLLDWGRFLHLAWRSTSPVALTLELHPYLHASVLETSQVIQEALLSSSTCELTKVAFPRGRDPILMLAPEGDKHLKLHQTWRVALEGRHPFWAPDTAWFLVIWSPVALLALGAGWLLWLRLHPRRFKCRVSDSNHEPDWRRTASASLRPGGRLFRLPRDQGQEIGHLRLPGLGRRLEFRPANDQVRLADGRSGPARIPKSRCLGLDLPREELQPHTLTGQDHARRRVYLWVKKL